ncbi:hypothetical protein ACS0TY_019053 [Phlomoides rotata]
MAYSHVVQRWLPKRIILIRHGESLGTKDEDYISPDHNTPLTPQGVEQANQAGTLIRELLDCKSCNWQALPKSKVIGVREEDFGNFREPQKLKQLKEIRNKFGRFLYRFPEGESGADVYDRVSSKFNRLLISSSSSPVFNHVELCCRFS